MNAVIELNEFNFYEILSESDGVSIVFFSGPHCASCHHLRDLFEREAKQFTDYFTHFQAYEVKADVATALVKEGLIKSHKIL